MSGGYNSYPPPAGQSHSAYPMPPPGPAAAAPPPPGAYPPYGAPPPPAFQPGPGPGPGPGGPGPIRGNMGYGPDRNMRRHGPYDSSSNNPNMMQGPGQHSPPTRGWGPNANRNRRSASPDYSRGGSGGGGGGPPGRGFDDQNRYGQGPGQGPAHGGWGARVPPSRDNFGGGGGRGFNQYGGGPGGGGGGGGYDPAGGPSSRSGFQRMELGVFPGALSPRCRLASSSEMLLQNAIWQHSGVFVLSFGLTPEIVKRPFAEIGDIRTFFDLVEKRAMAFVTYTQRKSRVGIALALSQYDSRAAMMAKDRMHSFPIAGRPIDVHYSLPRDADLAQGCDRDKGQGTLSILVRDPPAGQTNGVSEQEVYQRFAQFGEIKSVYPSDKRPDVKFIEFYDSRACAQAYDAMNGAPLGGGKADLQFEWDKPEALPQHPAGPPPVAGGYGRPPPPHPQAGFGGPPPPMGGASPYAGGHLAGPPPPAAPNMMMMGGPPPVAAPPPPPPNMMGAGPTAAPPPAVAAIAPGAAAHGLEQAKKMQDLLANLVANQGLISNLGGMGAGGPAQSGPNATQGPPPPAPPAAGGPPAPSAYAGSPAPPTPTTGSLPPAVSQLLQQAGAARGSASPISPAYGAETPPTPSSEASPVSAPAAAPAPAAASGGGSTPAQVQALLAMLAQQKSQSQ
ncbi:hypothetical protein C6P46_004931 [Rhodotorula mucilaginosa]|uniref:RRM domain-containing protein n=1 Tax=Rhodotorula mucilaginosa TaxID=5537 RepID=A0A9P6W9F0_RHOMI|nr:hypothetical protein C6P46_004931 [Rhodotorula mucilaginosa]